jgi:hypothetical protein
MKAMVYPAALLEFIDWVEDRREYRRSRGLLAGGGTVMAPTLLKRRAC